MMRILVATDGSDAASRAVELAARLASGLGGTLKIVTIVGGYDLPREQLSAFSRQEHAASDAFRSNLSEKTLAMAKQRAMELGAPDVQSESQSGDVATSIIDVARRDGADVIVLGKRGLGRLTGLLLGSVSQKLVSLAPCAVIIVP